MDKGSISVAFVQEALNAAHRRGLAPAPLLQRAGIAPNLLHSAEARVTPASFGTLWLCIAAALDDEFFGLDTRRMKVGSFALLCRSTLHARTLRGASAQAIKFFCILLDDTVIRLEIDGTDGRIVLSSTGKRDPARQADMVFAHETLLVMLHGLMSWLIARRIPVNHAAFAYARPAWWKEYLAIYSNSLSFDQPETSMVFTAELLDLPIVQTRRSVGEFLRGAPANFVLKYKDESSLSALIRKRLREQPCEQWPLLDSLAKDFGIGASTLHRRLEREGLSYQALKDSIRCDLAIRQLTQSRLRMAEIAQNLGFAEPSAFHRAFRQWTGLRPGDYRRGLIGSR